jgi:uridine kinase
MPPNVSAAAAAVLTQSLTASPTLGTSRLICIDGPAGAGKTTLARSVLDAAASRAVATRLISMDDLYEGWAGLGNVARRVRDNIVKPLAAGRPGHYRRWDWLADEWAEEHHIDPVPLLVIEGVGSAALEYADRVGTLVWVDAPADLRLVRGLERDGEGMRYHWETWMVAEAEHFARQRTRERADLLVSGVQIGDSPAAPAASRLRSTT